MKLQIQLKGTFSRIPIDLKAKEVEAITSEQWMRSHFAVATQVRQRSPLLLRQKFGMNFLSESSIEQLLQQAHDSIPLWRLHQEAIEAKPTLYHYQFVNQQAQIQLQPDDPQLPDWETDSIAGTYKIAVKGNTYPGVSQIWLDTIWLQVKQEWEKYSNCDRLKMALQLLNNDEFNFYLIDIPEVKVTIDIQQFPLEIREAIAFLRQERKDLESLSIAAVELVSQYQTENTATPIDLPLPKEITPKASSPDQHQFVIGKRISRKVIEELISQAEQFLFVSSYIIEDRNITELICQKATTLPQGVWLLTDLRDEVIDAIDTQVEDLPRSREAYQHSDDKKAQCLKLLLDAGVRIRGGAFHLKTYITEKAAYLGSCNLTGGSLDFNLESGLICQGTATHQDLWQYFTRCWSHKTKYDVLSLQSGFNQRTLESSSPNDRFNSQALLTPRQYREDLYRELNKCSQKVEIYSRGFSPDAEILNLLANCSTRIYAEGFIRNKSSRITTHFTEGVHAKVTLIGDRLAYLGGVNFQFAPQGFKLIDLMYKTSDRQEITQIRQQLAALSF
jgi:hypothetical protein